MNLELILTLSGSAIFLFAFILYNKDILKGEIKPSIVTWSLFSIITFINSLSYLSFTGDVLKSFLAFTDFFVCIVITSIILFKGAYSSLSKLEKGVIAFCAVSLSAWAIFQSALFANLLLQPSLILAFVPTLSNAYKNPRSEKTLPWFLWAFSFILSITVVLLRWNGVLADLVNPLIALSLHLAVGTLALRK